jgi:hypothetical protein
MVRTVQGLLIFGVAALSISPVNCQGTAFIQNWCNFETVCNVRRLGSLPDLDLLDGRNDDSVASLAAGSGNGRPSDYAYSVGVGFLFILQLRLCRLVFVNSVFLDQHHASGAINHYTTASRNPLGCSCHTHDSRNAILASHDCPMCHSSTHFHHQPRCFEKQRCPSGVRRGSHQDFSHFQVGCIRIKDHPRARRHAPSRGRSPSQRPFRLGGTLGNLSLTCWVSAI